MAVNKDLAEYRKGIRMDRLTRCVGYQNGNQIYKTNVDMRRIDAVDKLKNALGKYEDAEEQGLLLRLPFKIGDTVYYISEGFIEPCTVEIIFLADYTDKDGNCSYMAEIHYDREDCPYVSTEIYFTDIGKTVFLTQSEAEQKLNELAN